MADFSVEEYLDVLQNIEVGLVSAYQDNPNLTDTGTMYAIETLIKVYSGQLQGREVALAVIIVSAMAPLQAALRPLFERFAAGRAGTSR